MSEKDQPSVDRRTVIKSAGAVALGFATNVYSAAPRRRIVRALDAGCDVITEKPMTTTAEKAQRILDACKRNGRHVRVTFNYRYSPPRTQIKEMLMNNEIGEALSVDFNCC
jgi:hypothetical protein